MTLPESAAQMWRVPCDEFGNGRKSPATTCNTRSSSAASSLHPPFVDGDGRTDQRRRADGQAGWAPSWQRPARLSQPTSPTQKRNLCLLSRMHDNELGNLRLAQPKPQSTGRI
jgi:hypothetical protein